MREKAPWRAAEDVGEVVGVEGFRLGGAGEDGTAGAGGGAVLHGSAARKPRR